MKRLRYIQEISTRGLWIAFVLLFLMGCTEDKNEPDEKEPAPSGQVTVSFSVDTQTIVSRADNIEVYENAINSLDILVFEEEEEEEEKEFILKYQTTAEIVNNSTYTYTVDLYPATCPVKLYLLANINMEEFSHHLGNTENEIKKEKFILDYPVTEEMDKGAIPMFGEIKISEGLSEDTPLTLETVTLVRSLAAVTVENTATDFTLTSIQGYRANNKIRIIPEELVDNKVSAPTIPEGSEAIITSERVEASQEVANGLYLPESKSATTTSEATCLIIGGKYDGSPVETYYRVDFRQGETFGQLLRNHRYNIKIKNVTGPGTTHPDDAVEVNIEYTIDDWSESDHNIEL
ncbi:MAG: fimbrial protein [Bacteroides sp.]|nr:fimbrial protein [Bacteroides sp.]